MCWYFLVMLSLGPPEGKKRREEKREFKGKIGVWPQKVQAISTMSEKLKIRYAGNPS